MINNYKMTNDAGFPLSKKEIEDQIKKFPGILQTLDPILGMYKTDTGKALHCFNVLLDASKFFNRQDSIKHLSLYKEGYNLKNKTPEEIFELDFGTRIHDNIVTDSFFLIAFLEKFLKVRLIWDGYLIHKTKKKPNTIDLPFKFMNYNENIHEDITGHSIQIGKLLDNPDYAKLLPIDPKLYGIFSTANKIRNKSHFDTHPSISFSSHSTENLKRIITFYNQEFLPLFNEIRQVCYNHYPEKIFVDIQLIDFNKP